MADQKRVQCPACQGVAFVRRNRVDDPFLTCPTCGAWNGRGAKYRAWCENLPALPEPGAKTEKVVIDEPPAEEQADWLEQWGRV